MSKKYIRSTLAVLSITTLLIGCGTKDAKNELTVKFITKCAFTNKDSMGWIESICMQNDINNNKRIGIYYSGDNIDFKTIEGNFIPIKNDKNEIIDKIDPINPSYLYDQSKTADIEEINTFLNTFSNEEMTLSDIESLNLDKINKSNIVDLYNRAMKSTTKIGPYFFNYLPTNIDVLPLNNFAMLQVGYMNDYGNIKDINLKIIDKSIDNSNLNKINENLDAIEKQIKTNNGPVFDQSKLPNQDVLKLMDVDLINNCLTNYFVPNDLSKK